MINKTIGKYTITRKIGEGGMASVYEGIHEKLGTKVAIKILSPILARNPQLRQRFENEANFMASLDHPHITRVLDIEEQDETLAIVMELLKGEDLDERVKRTGPLSNAEVKVIFTQVLNAFDYAHSKGIVHRDIKPANIFIDKNNQVKILDFGIAKIFGTGNEMTQTGTQMGTPVYMSPEQVKGEKSIDHRSDIYALGITLYFLLSGKAPYESAEESSFEIFMKIVNEPIPNLPNNNFFNSIIKKFVAKDRNERFQSIEEIIIELSTFDDSSTIKLQTEKDSSEIIKSNKVQFPKKKIIIRASLFLLFLAFVAIFYYRLFVHQIPNKNKLDNDLSEMGLYGDIKNIEENYDSDPNWGTQTTKKENGLFLSGFLGKDYFSFDKKGNIIQHKSITDFKSSKYKPKIYVTNNKNVYNEENQLVRTSYYNNLNENWTKYSYDNGYLIKEVSSDPNNFYEYEYGRDGKLLFWKSKKYRKEFKYDENNECNSQLLFEMDALTYKCVKFHENGKLIETIEYDYEGKKTVQKTVRKYNNLQDEYYSKVIYASNKTPDIEEYKYDYDKNGNWVKKERFSVNSGNKKNIISITKRKIEYYN